MLSLTSGTFIATGKKKDSDFKLFFKDEDGEPQIDVKDIFSLFDKNEIHFFLDDYSLKLDEFKQLLEMARANEHPPENLDISLHKAFRRLQNKIRAKMTRELKFGDDVELLSKVFRNRGWTPPVLICGATGAGKSYLCAKLLTDQTTLGANMSKSTGRRTPSSPSRMPSSRRRRHTGRSHRASGENDAVSFFLFPQRFLKKVA